MKKICMAFLNFLPSMHRCPIKGCLHTATTLASYLSLQLPCMPTATKAHQASICTQDDRPKSILIACLCFCSPERPVIAPEALQALAAAYLITASPTLLQQPTIRHMQLILAYTPYLQHPMAQDHSPATLMQHTNVAMPQQSCTMLQPAFKSYAAS